MEIILVLGSPNEADGTLSEMALARLAECIKLYKRKPYKIALTGGFGAHFNESAEAHAVYLKEHLIAAGIATGDILALVESANSVEDATLSKWIIAEYNPESIIVITSDYHHLRAELIFETVYAPYTNITFQLAASEKVCEETLQKLIAHEEQALKGLIEFGVRY